MSSCLVSSQGGNAAHTALRDPFPLATLTELTCRPAFLPPWLRLWMYPGGNLRLVEGLLSDSHVLYNSVVDRIDCTGRDGAPVVIHTNAGPSYQGECAAVRGQPELSDAFKELFEASCVPCLPPSPNPSSPPIPALQLMPLL